MNLSHPDRVSLLFPLEVDDDGWPPVGVESLPFQRTPAGFLALVPPLFVKDLSVGDVIAAKLDPSGRVDYWQHVSRSGRTTVWLLRLDDTETIEPVLAQLRQLGCSTVRLPEAGTYSVDVPEMVLMDSVDSALKRLDSDAVALAFPSMRHPE